MSVDRDCAFYMQPENAYAFMKEVLVHGFDLLEPKPHVEMVWFWTNPGGKRNRLMAVCRDSYKSTILRGFIVWDICNRLYTGRKNFNYILDSATQSLARRNFVVIKRLLKTKKLREWFGEFSKKGLWEREFLNIAQQVDEGEDIKERAEPTLKISSTLSDVTGWHSKFVVADDWITDKNHNTEYSREIIKRHRKEIMNVVDKEDGHLYIGCTFWHPDDAYQELINTPGIAENFDFFIRPIYEHEPDGGVKLFFPRKFNWRTIQRLKQELGSQFETQYMMKPMSEEYKYFPDKHWQDIDRKAVPELRDVWIAYDPAETSANQWQACYDAIIVVGVDTDFNAYIMDLFIEVGMSPTTALDTLCHLGAKYSQTIRAILIEKTLGEKWAEKAIMDEFRARGVYYPLAFVNVDKHKTKKDRIQTLDVRWRRNGLFVVNDIPETARRELRSEFQTYPNCRYFDCLDALAMAERNIISQPRPLTKEEAEQRSIFVHKEGGAMGVKAEFVMNMIPMMRAEAADAD